MNKIRLFHNLTKHAWKVICQQFWLLAVLSMLFLALPMAAGPVAEQLLTQGVEFSGLTFGVCAPEGDDTGALLEELTGRMQDISRYAAFESVTREEGEERLARGELTAVLILPENFIGGVLGGTNPDVTLIVSGDKPLESLLALWVGQSAADLLTSAQKGIYAVLDAYPPEGMGGTSWEQAKNEINLSFISRTLNRQEIFRLRQLKATESMDLGTHYALSLLIFLTMALPPVLYPLFGDTDAPFRRRLLSLGHGTAVQYGSSLGVGVCVLLPVVTLPALMGGWNWAGGVLLALFGAAFSSVCCLLSRSTAGCGGIAFPAAAGAVFLAGGVLPTPLLPAVLQKLGAFSPAALLRTLLYLELPEWGDAPDALAGSILWILGLGVLGLLLYRRRLRKEVR